MLLVPSIGGTSRDDGDTTDAGRRAGARALRPAGEPRRDDRRSVPGRPVPDLETRCASRRRCTRAPLHELVGDCRRSSSSRTACIRIAPTFRRSPMRPAMRPIAIQRCSRPRRGGRATSTRHPRARTACLSMGGREHRRYRAARATVIRPGQGAVVDPELDRGDRPRADRRIRRLGGRAELNVDFCAAIPVLTITGSFGIPVERALDVRERQRSGPRC